jgi:uncharacterized protein YdeI (YjbR/CyaY-like superfamily)
MPRSPTPGSAERAPTLPFVDAAAFDAWLDEHSGDQDGVWLKLAKVASGIPSLTSKEAVDVGLCHGWVSGQYRSLDDTYHLQRYVPRRPRSVWSQVNVGKVEQLTAAGRMRPAGIAEVAAAKADGRWDAAYAGQATATVPADLAQALAKIPAASAAFDALSKSERFVFGGQVRITRTEPGRKKCIERIVSKLAASERGTSA